MTNGVPFEIQATGTEKMIIRATYEALIKYGYADLTVKHIGAHFGKTTSLIYQYYDGKDDLLVTLLRQLLAQFEEDSVVEDGNAHEQLLAAIEPLQQTNSDYNKLLTAVYELRAQAAHNPQFREEFAKLDTAYTQHLQNLIELGIDQGIYKDVPPVPVAEHIYATMVGTGLLNVNTRRTASSEESHRELNRYFRLRLLAVDRKNDENR